MNHAEILNSNLVISACIDKENIKLDFSNQNGMLMIQMEYDNGDVEIIKHLSIQY